MNKYDVIKLQLANRIVHRTDSWLSGFSSAPTERDWVLDAVEVLGIGHTISVATTRQVMKELCNTRQLQANVQSPEEIASWLVLRMLNSPVQPQLVVDLTGTTGGPYHVHTFYMN